MKRINIIGTTGSGKSTFALALAKQLGCPCIHIDQLFLKPNWEESSDGELIPKLKEAISGEAWVLDGNYSRAREIKWERADTIVWLDFGFIRTLFQLIKRTIVRAYFQQELWPGTGNRESFSRSFLSNDSIIVWFFRSYGKNRTKYHKLMHSVDYDQIEMIRLKNPSEAKRFIKNAHKKV